MPNRVQWESLEPGTYEDMVAVLISRLNPSAQRIDGSGGDGGRDVQVPTDDGLTGYEIKCFAEDATWAPPKCGRFVGCGPDSLAWVALIDPTPDEL